jgi:hypothetical protein
MRRATAMIILIWFGSLGVFLCRPLTQSFSKMAGNNFVMSFLFWLAGTLILIISMQQLTKIMPRFSRKADLQPNFLLDIIKVGVLSVFAGIGGSIFPLIFSFLLYIFIIR